MSELDASIRSVMACRTENFLKLYCLELLVRQVNDANGGRADIVSALKETARKATAFGKTDERDLRSVVWAALDYALENLPFVPGIPHRFTEDTFEAFKEAWEEQSKVWDAERQEREEREAASKKKRWS